MIHSYYKQLDVAAMGSRLGPALFNAFFYLISKGTGLKTVELPML